MKGGNTINKQKKFKYEHFTLVLSLIALISAFRKEIYWLVSLLIG